jgi:hypothetical protein
MWGHSSRQEQMANAYSECVQKNKRQAKCRLAKGFSPVSHFPLFMKQPESINLARDILKQKGFTNITFVGKPYDLEAEKDGTKYAIEVKGSNISFTTSWSQLRDIYYEFWLKYRHCLLMFVTEGGQYCIFEMTDNHML